MRLFKDKWFPISLATVSTLGLFDAVLLTINHYTNSNLACTITQGCEQVLTSKYSTIFGIPISLAGVLFYFSVLVISIYTLTNYPPKRLLMVITSVGFVTTLVLLYLQAFVISAWCQYCLISALSSTILFLIVLFNQREEKPKHDKTG